MKILTASLAVLTILLLTVRGQTPAVSPAFNYQGRLTDDQGQALASGEYAIAFRLWSDPTSASTADPNHLVWGRERAVTVVNGAFNVILDDTGAPVAGAQNAEVAAAFGGATRYLGLTLTRTPAGTVPAAQRKELLPRQQILSSPFALSSQTAAAVLPGSITSESIRADAVQTIHLATGSVALSKLVARPRGTNVPAGGIAVSLPVVEQKLTGAAYEKIQNLAVTIETTGRPVMIFLAPSVLTNFPATPAGTPNSGLYFIVAPGADLGRFRLLRDGGQAAISTFFGSGAGGSSSVGYSTVLGPLIDFPDPGTHRYELEWGFQSSGPLEARIFNQVLVAFEL